MGSPRFEAGGGTLGDVVAEVAGRFPRLAPRLRDATGGPYPFVTYYLNDEDVRFRSGFATPVGRATRSPWSPRSRGDKTERTQKTHKTRGREDAEDAGAEVGEDRTSGPVPDSPASYASSASFCALTGASIS